MNIKCIGIIGITILTVSFFACASVEGKAPGSSDTASSELTFNQTVGASTARVVLQTPLPAVVAVAASKDGRYAAFGSNAGDIVVRQLSDNLIVSWIKETGMICGLSFSSDGNRLAVFIDHSVKILDTFSGALVVQIPEMGSRGLVGYGPNDRSIWVGNNSPDQNSCKLLRFTLKAGHEPAITNSYEFNGLITSIDTDEANAVVALSFTDGNFIVFSDSPSNQDRVFEKRFTGTTVIGVGFESSGNEWLLMLGDKSLIRISTKNLVKLPDIETLGSPKRVLFFDNNKQAAIVVEIYKQSYRLELWNLKTGTVTRSPMIDQIPSSRAVPLGIAITPDYKRIFTNISDKRNSNFVNAEQLLREATDTSALIFSVDDYFNEKNLRIQLYGESGAFFSSDIDLGFIRSDDEAEKYSTFGFGTLYSPKVYSLWDWDDIQAVGYFSRSRTALVCDDQDLLVVSDRPYAEDSSGWRNYLVKRVSGYYTCELIYDIPTDYVNEKQISRNGYLVTKTSVKDINSKKPSLVVSDLKVGKALWSLPARKLGASFISSQGKYVFVIHKPDQNCKVFDGMNGKELFSLFPRDFGIRGFNLNLTVDPTESRFAVAVTDGFMIQSFANRQLKTKIPAKIGSLDHGSLSFSSDGRFLYWNEMDRLVIASIETGRTVNFIRTEKDWLFYTDDGYFEGSRGAGRFLAIVENGRAYGVDQFAVRYNRPDIIMERLGFAGENPDLHDFFQERYRKRLARMGIRESDMEAPLALPAAAITGLQATEGRVLLTARFEDEAAGLSRYSVYVNDVPLFGAEGAAISGSAHEVEVPIVLTPGKNKIEVSCFNIRGTESLRVLTSADGPQTASMPDLWYLGFGVSDYANPDLTLNYAHKDALDLESAFSVMAGTQYAVVHTKSFINADVRRDTIAEAKSFLAAAKEGDYVILFIAGHGIYTRGSADPDYYYVIHDTDIADLEGTAIKFAEIEELLQGIPSRQKLFLMDTCNSGEAEDEYGAATAVVATATKARAIRGLTVVEVRDGSKQAPRSWLQEKNRYIQNDLIRRSGAVVLSSSKGGEYSYETDEARNGLFTSAILEAVVAGSGADANWDGLIGVRELATYVARRVDESSGGLQHPGIDRDNLMVDFTLPVLALRQ